MAPSPTGFLHVGHARTFWIAQERARLHGGTLVLRVEDLDVERCKPKFVSALMEDLRWFGFIWHEGPDRGGKVGPYLQSQRREYYGAAFEKLRQRGLVYPCSCSRQDVLRALRAPHAGEEEPIYPGTCRARSQTEATSQLTNRRNLSTKYNWRFKVPGGEVVSFEDGNYGLQRFVAGHDFGDFVVWRHDDQPSYQLAVTVDDAAMGITEVVRGVDLLMSTARQLLIYNALRLTPPRFFHCLLVTDPLGYRLAKRHDALSLRTLRARGETADSIRKSWTAMPP